MATTHAENPPDPHREIKNWLRQFANSPSYRLFSDKIQIDKIRSKPRDGSKEEASQKEG